MLRFIRPTVLVLMLLGAGCSPEGPRPWVAPIDVTMYGASWCGLCRQAKPIFLELKAAEVSVLYLDVDQMVSPPSTMSLPWFRIYIGHELYLETGDVRIVVATVRKLQKLHNEPIENVLSRLREERAHSSVLREREG